MSFNILLIFLIGNLFCVQSSSNHTHRHIQYKYVNLNDNLELDCNIDISNNSFHSNKTNDSNSNNINDLNHLSNVFSIYIFKKDSILYRLNETKLKIDINDTIDQGVYECGYYKFDKYGYLSYYYQNSWVVKLNGKIF